MKTRRSVRDVRLLVIAGGLVLSACPSSGDRAGQDPARQSDSVAPPPDDGIDDQSRSTLPEAGTTSPDAEPPPSCATPRTPQPPDGTQDVVLTVRANAGPHGAASPIEVDRKIHGTSIADWRPDDYKPAPKPTFLAYLSAMKPGVLRWPAGHRSQEYNWVYGGSGQTGWWTLTAAEVDAFIALAKAVSAEPLIAINVKRGTPAAAASLVRYLNVEHDYGVTWFQVGNEPDLTDDMTAGPEVYANQLIAFSDAMRAVDPSVKIVGPEMLTGAHVGGMHGKVDWMTPILERAGDRLNAISWHYYPLDTGQTNPSSSAIFTVEHLFQETAPDWRPASIAFADEIMPLLAKMSADHTNGAQTWVTEFAEDPGPGAGTGISDALAGALWTADALGRYAEYGPGAVLRWVFKSVAGHGYTLIDTNDQPRPNYGMYWLFAQHVGKRFVDATSSDRTVVATHAALRDDHALTVILVNKTTAAKRVHVDLTGFDVCSAEHMTLDGDDYASTTFRINDRPLTVENLAPNAIAPIPAAEAELFDVDMPPTSVRVMAYRR